MTDLTPSALALAIRFHETYERLAPSFGYETRTDTRQFDPESKNGRLMVAVCGELAGLVPTPPPAPEVEAIRERARKISEGIEKWSAIDLGHAAMMAPEDVRTLLSALTAATQRAEAAERELADANSRLESAALTLAEAVRERDEAKEALKTAQYGYRTMRGMLAKERTSAPPAAPSELAEELITEIMEYADPEGGKAHQLMLRAASALSTPGSEAPMVAALRERVRELKYALRDVFSEAREHIPEDLAKDARAQIDFDESTLTPLPASPAAGKEAM